MLYLVYSRNCKNNNRVTAELQIREGTEDNLKIIFFLFLTKNVCCDQSLEPSRQDSSNDGLHNTIIFLISQGKLML